jgi:flagellar P-ring protein precursor FlgI
LVQVTGELGPYKLEGSTMDVTVSTLGDCKSLQGGQLLPTPLKGLDNVVYAVTRALAISTASWTVESSATGSKIAKNHPTSGTIIGGAYVERSEVSQIIESIGGKRYVTFKLRNSDYTTIERIRKAVDEMYPGSGFVENAGTIHVRVPEEIGKNDDMMFVDTLLQLQVEVDMPAVIVINEKTGTIVVGGNVTISETAVAQGSLVVKIKEQSIVSQPGAPFTSGATTAIVPDTSISVVEDPGYLIRVPQTLTVSDLVDGLNAIGASPRDLIAIFNALKVAGALQAEIKMM